MYGRAVDLRAARAASAASSAARLGLGPREAVEDRAIARVGLAEPVEEHPDRQVVGHELAAIHVLSWLRGRAAVPDSRRPRNRSPVATCGSPSRSARTGACVPLPAPGPPRSTSTHASPDEAFVVAHHQLRLDLLHGFDHDADHDEDARAAKAEAAEPGRMDETMYGETATMPRKKAPASVIRKTTLAR